MLKITNNVRNPIRMDMLKAGDTFTYEGEVYLMVNFNGTPRPVNLNRANWSTNIHSDTRVLRCECELTVI